MRGAAVNTDNAPNWPTNRDFINAPVRGESESIILLQLERMAIFECNCWWRLDQNLDWFLLCVLICRADGAWTSFLCFLYCIEYTTSPTVLPAQFVHSFFFYFKFLLAHRRFMDVAAAINSIYEYWTHTRFQFRRLNCSANKKQQDRNQHPNQPGHHTRHHLQRQSTWIISV